MCSSLLKLGQIKNVVSTMALLSILLLIVPGLVKAQNNQITFTINDCQFPDLGYSLDLRDSHYEGNTAQNYNGIDVFYGDPSNNNFIEMEIRYYQNTGSDFNSGLETYNTDVRRTQSTSGNFGPIEVVAPDSDHTRVSDITRALSTNDEGTIYGYRDFYQGLYIVNIHGKLKGVSDKDSVAMFDKVEAKARELLAKPPSSLSLIITHYQPLSSQCLNNPLQYPPGQLLFRVTDKQGKGVPGIKVAVFFERISQNDAGIFYSYHVNSLQQGLITTVGCPSPDKWEGMATYMTLITDANGQASYNYLNDYSTLTASFQLNYDRIAEHIDKEGVAETKLWAVVFDKDIDEINSLFAGMKSPNDRVLTAIGSNSQMIEFDHVAVVTHVATNIPDKVPIITVLRGSKDSKVADVANVACPYPLKPGDILEFNKGDAAELLFISNLKFDIHAKNDFFENPKYPDFKAYLKIGAQNLGWHYYMTGLVSGPGQATQAAAGSAFWMLVSTSTNAVKQAWNGVAFGLALGWYTADWYENPLLVAQVHSVLLVEADGMNATVSTIEGRVMLTNGLNQTVNVTTGQKINVSSQGVYGPINTFNEKDLSSDQQKSLQTAIAEQSQPTGPSPGTGNSSPTGSPRSGPLIFGVGAVLAIVAVGYLKRR
jgi:hypothetical protein